MTYLISEGWVEEEQIQKSVPLKTGTVIPQITQFYKITARGIDRIEGVSEFTMKKFHDIKIEATGQNIITVGDGNQVNVRYRDVAEGLASLRQAVMKRADLSEADKLNFVADIETMQSQLAKERPNHDVIRVVWENVKNVAVGVGLSADVATLAGLLAPLLL